ncbi:MAG TPA: hypothetical protein VGJ20_00500 [Xanthobacteraceae bacterium]|jgi:hypothetical protein
MAKKQKAKQQVVDVSIHYAYGRAATAKLPKGKTRTQRHEADHYVKGNFLFLQFDGEDKWHKVELNFDKSKPILDRSFVSSRDVPELRETEYKGGKPVK